jgi:hypothetical protein
MLTSSKPRSLSKSMAIWLKYKKILIKLYHTSK